MSEINEKAEYVRYSALGLFYVEARFSHLARDYQCELNLPQNIVVTTSIFEQANHCYDYFLMKPSLSAMIRSTTRRGKKF